jgi:hypothetical protein
VSTHITPAAGAREIAFAPALPDDMKVEPGIGYLTPGGLVVHTGWSRPLRGEPNERSQHPAYESPGVQPWIISTPHGNLAARFPYQTRPDAEAAAARIVTMLPGGTWPADGDTARLLPLLREASSGPELLPLTHKGKPDWGSGYGRAADFYLPDTRAEYQRMIAAHGRIPKACQWCARLVREQRKNGWLPRTNHWPVWQVHGRRPAGLVRPHCYCTVCMRLDVRMGTYGTVVDDEGNTQISSCAVYPWSDPANVTGREVERSDRAFAWFAHFLSAGGCVVLDERPGVGLWPEGVQHDDALFCETGETGADDAGLAS